jgi:hypothetical protein
MKPIATVILNRNLPKETDLLHEKVKNLHGDITDVYVVESGSDKNNLSKNSTWWANWEESLEHGLRYPRGFNFALSKLLEEGKYEKYEYFFLICNDAEVPSEGFLDKLLEIMQQHSRLGILSPCSRVWGERELIGSQATKYFWYINHVAWLVRRSYIDDVRELDKPSFMNFLYDGDNFRGYESEIELIAKGYVNDWATAITTKVFVDENKTHLFKKSDLIKTEPYEESLAMCVREGKKWMRKKYGFNSRWSMQMYSKCFYEKFFENYPQFNQFKI